MTRRFHALGLFYLGWEPSVASVGSGNWWAFFRTGLLSSYIYVGLLQALQKRSHPIISRDSKMRYACILDISYASPHSSQSSAQSDTL